MTQQQIRQLLLAQQQGQLPPAGPGGLPASDPRVAAYHQRLQMTGGPMAQQGQMRVPNGPAKMTGARSPLSQAILSQGPQGMGRSDNPLNWRENPRPML